MNTTNKAGDTVPTEVFASAAFPTVPTASDWIEVRGFTHIDWFFKCDNFELSTNLIVTVQIANDAAKSDISAKTYDDVDVSGLTIAIRPVEWTADIEGAFSSQKATQALRMPVAGQFMRVTFHSTAKGSDMAIVSALRRSA